MSSIPHPPKERRLLRDVLTAILVIVAVYVVLFIGATGFVALALFLALWYGATRTGLHR